MTAKRITVNGIAVKRITLGGRVFPDKTPVKERMDAYASHVTKKIKTPDRIVFDFSMLIPEFKTASFAMFAIGVSATRKLPMKRTIAHMGILEM
jgi:hypothetical protein